jgi:predicted phosphoribosyltransferase
MNPRTLIVAAPTASTRAAKLVREEVDDLLCPNIESGFVFAVANAYETWHDVPDSEARALLKKFR